MANEARVYAYGSENCIVRQFTVADANALAKGAALEQSGDKTGITHAGSGGETPLGFIVEEKEASDGKTQIGCQRTGAIVAVADGTVTTGDLVELGAVANRVRTVPPSVSLISQANAKRILGRAVDTATDGNNVEIVLTLG